MERVRSRLSVLVFALLVVPACSDAAAEATPEDAPADAAAVTEEGRSSGPSAVGDAPTELACAAGPALSDADLLARAPQGGAAAVTLVGRLRIATRTCEGERCVAELPREQADVAITLTRTEGGATWRGQVSPSESATLALEISASGALSGELVTFGEAASAAPIEGNATTACLGAKATVKRELGEGKRVETSLAFLVEVPAESNRIAVDEQPPVPACDQAAPVDYAFHAYGAAGGNMSSGPGAVLEQFRDCRAPTGCLPWQVAPVNADGSSPWATASAVLPAAPLTVSARTNNNGRNYFTTSVSSSAGASAVLSGFGGTFTTDVPLLGRAGSVDVKLSLADYVVREAGGARPDPSEPRVRSRRFVCLPYAK